MIKPLEGPKKADSWNVGNDLGRQVPTDFASFRSSYHHYHYGCRHILIDFEMSYL
jgi:hypothetical protein